MKGLQRGSVAIAPPARILGGPGRRQRLEHGRHGVLDAMFVVVAVRRGFGGLLHAVAQCPTKAADLLAAALVSVQ